MDILSKTIGERIRTYRRKKGWTQEELGEKAGLHNTYIGQIERGEKNLTVISLEKILTALNITFSDFFQCMDIRNGNTSYAARCYDLLNNKNVSEQARIYHLLWEIDQLMESAHQHPE